ADATLSVIQGESRGENSDDNVRVMAEFWGSVGIPRNMAKKPLMTRPYGATLLGTIHYIQEYVEDDLPAVKLPREDALKYYTYLTKKLFHGIDEAVPSISQVMRWLQEVVRDQKGVGLEWESPVGFPVHHDYQKFKTRTVRLNSCGVKTVLVRE